MKQEIERLKQQIAALEKRIQKLETQPREYHHHYHAPVVLPPIQPPVEMPYRITVGDPPFWPNTTGTVTWSAGGY